MRRRPSPAPHPSAPLIALVLLATPALPAADPSNEQQYWLELINRMRTNPAAELDRLVNFSSPGVWAPTKSTDPFVTIALDYFNTSASALQNQWATLTPAPALAWNPALALSASLYSNAMVAADQQDHNLDGQSLDQRIANGGYSPNYLDLGESLFSAAETIFHGHAAFAIDWGDSDTNPSNGFGTGIQTPALHRDVMMDPAFKEVGIGFQSIPIPAANTIANGPLVTTQHFGSQFRFDAGQYFSDAILTGVLYEDSVVSDNFYTPGEGVANAAIELWDSVTNSLLLTTITNSAGGYNLTAPNLIQGRTYSIRAPSSGQSDVTFIATATDQDYGAIVTVFDNAYASFQVVPEPSSALLLLFGFLPSLRRQRATRP